MARSFPNHWLCGVLGVFALAGSAAYAELVEDNSERVGIYAPERDDEVLLTLPYRLNSSRAGVKASALLAGMLAQSDAGEQEAVRRRCAALAKAEGSSAGAICWSLALPLQPEGVALAKLADQLGGLGSLPVADRAIAFVAQARLLRYLGASDLVVASASSAFFLDPSSHAIRAAYADALMDTGQYAEAYLLAQASPAFEREAASLARLVRAANFLGKTEAAERYRAALAAMPRDDFAAAYVEVYAPSSGDALPLSLAAWEQTPSFDRYMLLATAMERGKVAPGAVPPVASWLRRYGMLRMVPKGVAIR